MRDLATVQRKTQRGNATKEVTIREFNGGWNVIDNELNLSSKYAVVLDNMSREEDGSVGVRWGTRLFSDVSTLAGSAKIVNIRYYNEYVVVVLSDGRLLRVDGTGAAEVIWDNTIAGAPGGWTATDFASFAIFNGELIVCNGRDKPLLINFTKTPSVTYLQDLSTGSNANVPICRYVLTFNRFLVMAGDPLHPDRVYISNEGTSGTWPSDPAPNNAVYVDLGRIGVQSEQVITGLNRYRNQLVVAFWSALVIGRLGIYTDDNKHTPEFEDVIESVGSHSHRCMVNIGKDLLMLDHGGVPSLSRSLYSGEVEPKRASELIDPAINANVAKLNDADTLLRAHAVYNTNDQQYMCFVPNYNDGAVVSLPDDALSIVPERTNTLRVYAPAHGLVVGDLLLLDGVTGFNTLDPAMVNAIEHPVTRVINADFIEIEPSGFDADLGGAEAGGGNAITLQYRFTETIGYVYTVIDELKVRAWARFRGWKWTASTPTELGRVMFSDEQRIFVLGYSNDPIYADFEGTDDVRPIEWIFELPWSDFEDRTKIKHTRHLMLDTTGDAHFSAMMFVDNIYKVDGVLFPAIGFTMVGGDSGGFGRNPQPYGGGRNTSDQRLYDWTVRCKLSKLRFQGSTSRPLRIVAISMVYQSGSVRR